MQEKFLRWSQVRELIPLSRTTVWRLIRRGDFPKPIPLAKRSVGWLESDLKAWAEKRRLESVDGNKPASASRQEPGDDGR